MPYLFISHGLFVIRHIGDRIATMYQEKLAELASTDCLFDNPLHPYTKKLLVVTPIADPVLAGGAMEQTGIRSTIILTPLYERIEAEPDHLVRREKRRQ